MRRTTVINMATTVMKSVIMRPQNWFVNKNPFYAFIRPFCSGHQLEKTSISDSERPHMLHAVWRVRGLTRRPDTERKLCSKLGLHRRFQPVIHKNTPQVNILLSKIRHLIRIKPVILKDGVPEESDFENCLLKWNGELVIRKTIGLTSENMEASLESGMEVTGKKS